MTFMYVLYLKNINILYEVYLSCIAAKVGFDSVCAGLAHIVCKLHSVCCCYCGLGVCPLQIMKISLLRINLEAILMENYEVVKFMVSLPIHSLDQCLSKTASSFYSELKLIREVSCSEYIHTYVHM